MTGSEWTSEEGRLWRRFHCGELSESERAELLADIRAERGPIGEATARFIADDRSWLMAIERVVHAKLPPEVQRSGESGAETSQIVLGFSLPAETSGSDLGQFVLRLALSIAITNGLRHAAGRRRGGATGESQLANEFRRRGSISLRRQGLILLFRARDDSVEMCVGTSPADLLPGFLAEFGNGDVVILRKVAAHGVLRLTLPELQSLIHAEWLRVVEDSSLA